VRPALGSTGQQKARLARAGLMRSSEAHTVYVPSRASTRETCVAAHLVPPLAVGMPRS
jgi:hypothetical protein